MGFKRWFGDKGRDEEPHAYVEYTLATMRVGFLVDYDLKTWEVTGVGTYDYDGYHTEEWEMTADRQVHFLERAIEDGRAVWTLSHAIDFNAIEGDIVAAVAATGDPPESVRFAGLEYVGEESGAGLYRAGGEGEGREFVSWSFAAADGQLLFISQWGEREFSAFAGIAVEEYQFTDILPAGEN